MGFIELRDLPELEITRGIKAHAVTADTVTVQRDYFNFWFLFKHDDHSGFYNYSFYLCTKTRAKVD